MTVADVVDEEVGRVLGLAHSYARRRARGLHGEAREQTEDAATDAVVRAWRQYDPARGPFGPWAMSFVRREVSASLRKGRDKRERRPHTDHITDDSPELVGRDLPTAGRVPMTAELADLAPDLRDAVRFYFIDGFTMEECGLLLGVSVDTVRVRLHRAAEALDPDGTRRGRTPGEKRLKRG